MPLVARSPLGEVVVGAIPPRVGQTLAERSMLQVDRRAADREAEAKRNKAFSRVRKLAPVKFCRWATPSLLACPTRELIVWSSFIWP